MHIIRKGLDLPIQGTPARRIDAGPFAQRVALLGDDYVGMKPTMVVSEGDTVKRGQVLFHDKKTVGVQHTSPAAGTVTAINRGRKRRFQSIVIDIDGDGEEAEQAFASYDDSTVSELTGDQVRENLVQSGLWTALRTRPYSKVAAPDGFRPHSIFVTAIDTRPLAAPPELIIEGQDGDFQRGLRLLTKLTEGNVYVCTRPEVTLPPIDDQRIKTEQFSGPHPAGLPGTHIHLLDPVSENKTVWHIQYQDVIAIGKLFITGRLPVDRIVSLAGSAVKTPRLIRSRIGAAIHPLISGELGDCPEVRVLSGSVLDGREATGPFAYLGRFHQQISVVPQGGDRVLLDWMRPGVNRFSIKNAFASAVARGTATFPFSTSQEGSQRPMVPIEMYEKVMPLDILPTFLLRALITQDLQQARALGCLELDEEDLALCAFVCPGKYEYGPMLRDCLTVIEREG